MQESSKDFGDMSPDQQQRLRSAAKLLATGAVRAAAKAVNENCEPDEDCGSDSKQDPE